MKFQGWVARDGRGRSHIAIISDGGRMVLRVWGQGRWAQQGYGSFGEAMSSIQGVIKEWELDGYHLGNQITVEHLVRPDDLTGERFTQESMDRIFKPYLDAANTVAG